MAIESFNGRCTFTMVLRRSMLSALIVVTILNEIVLCQENIQTRIPHSLVECYDNPEIFERDNRLPATINTLIELIRKIEDSPVYTQDIRQIAVGLLHRFRLDGIEHAQGNFPPYVLPFSPSGYQFSKHRLLLSRLIPGNAANFPNNTLTAVERCTLHFMISSSIETQVRGDEATRCGQLAQFRSMRIPHPFSLRKKRHSYIPRNNYLCDIEMMSDMSDTRRCQRQRGQYSTFRGRTTTQRPEEDDDFDEENDGDAPIDPDYHIDPNGNSFGRDGLIDVASNAISQCPVENGVMRTTWGAVAVGPLLAGIAAGLVQQNVATRELLQLTRAFHGRQNGRQQVQLTVDNRWAATLAGDLSEVTLLQGPMTRQISVGASGAWNSTTIPHWYFLSQREHLEMTDAEIRGGIDGLLLATNIAEWRRQTSNLRLSQLLDMYYSQRGVFSSNVKSCNRRELFAKNIQPNQLAAQTTAFSTVLDREIQLRVTINNEAIRQFSNAATETLFSYVENGLNDVTCNATSAVGPSSELHAASDLHIFLDAAWQFNEVQPAIATLLENLDVNRYGSRVTLYNANDGSIIVNQTSSLNEFYSQWNQTTYQQQTSGLNLASVIRQLRSVGADLLNEEHSHSSLAGRSFVALVIPQMAGVNEADSNFAAEQIMLLREILPDLTLLFWSGGSPGRFARFVRDQNKDLFNLMSVSSGGADSSQQIYTYATPVIQRIQHLPRRIVNPRCTSEWQQSDSGGNAIDQYVEPSGVNFYRIHPNYFYHSGGMVRVQSRSQSQIAVCSSRTEENPRHNNSSQPVDNVNCRQLMPSESFDIDLGGACDGHYLIQSCPPLYISVEGVVQTQNNFQCSEPACRFPDNVKFNVNIENLGCYSSTSKIISQITIIVFSIVVSVGYSFY